MVEALRVVEGWVAAITIDWGCRMNRKAKAMERLERETRELIDCFRCANKTAGDGSLVELAEQIIAKVESALAEMRRNLD